MGKMPTYPTNSPISLRGCFLLLEIAHLSQIHELLCSCIYVVNIEKHKN